MPRLHTGLLVLVAASLLLAACGDEPTVTASPTPAAPTPSVEPTPSASEVPFERASWPSTGSACELEGYTGLMGRIVALDARTVRFTLCSPDGAFPARVAHPAMQILDTAVVESLAADPALGRALPGTGRYRIDHWESGVEIVLTAAGAGDNPSTDTVVVRWAASAAQRTVELQSATVDGIDGPGPLDVERIETQPELALVPRAGMATAYLAFQAGGPFSDARARRAIATGLDRAALVATAFPAGSTVPEQVAPCVVPAGCGGDAWPAFDAPAAAAALKSADFNLNRVYSLHVPNRAVAGLPDPMRVAEAVRDQLEENLGIAVAIDAMSIRDYGRALEAGELDGMYLGGVASTLADPSAFLDPLVGRGAVGRLRRAVPDVPAILDEARATADPAAREAAYARANDEIRENAPFVPLAHPGSMTAFRSDVADVRTSPLGLESLGSFTPGDRLQIVFLQASEPAGVYCGDQDAFDAYRVCALVTDSLYGFAPGTATPEPRLASACTPDETATTWTCRLRAGLTFHDGAALDAGDVLASYVAQWDRSQPMHTARPEATFDVWRELFGAFLEPAAER